MSFLLGLAKALDVRLVVREGERLLVDAPGDTPAVILDLVRHEKTSLLLALTRPPDHLASRAADLLCQFRADFGRQLATDWLGHFDRAHQRCIETFPASRLSTALRGYRARYCEAVAAHVVAAHTITLELWAAERLAGLPTTFGLCLEAACVAVTIDPYDLPARLSDSERQPATD